MAKSILDPFRDQILSLYRKRTKQKDILEWLQTEHGVSIGRSSLSDFIQAETKGDSAPPPSPAAAPDYDAAQELLRTYLQDARATLQDAADIKESVAALYRITQGLSEKLDGLATAPQGKPIPAATPLLPAVVRGIWLRASLATVGVECLLLLVLGW